MLNHWFGSVRWLWNHALEMRTKAYKRRKESITGVDISRHVTKLKKLPRFDWLTKVPATCLRSACGTRIRRLPTSSAV